MDAVFAVVLEVGAFRDFYYFDSVYAFADGEDGEGLVWEVKGGLNFLVIESPDYYCVKAYLNGLEGHALEGDSKVYVYGGSLRAGAADDDERVGLRSGGGQMEFREKAAKVEVAAEVSIVVNKFEAEDLGVLARGELGVDGHNRLQLPSGNLVGGIIRPVAAVLE